MNFAKRKFNQIKSVFQKIVLLRDIPKSMYNSLFTCGHSEENNNENFVVCSLLNNLIFSNSSSFCTFSNHKTGLIFVNQSKMGYRFFNNVGFNVKIFLWWSVARGGGGVSAFGAKCSEFSETHFGQGPTKFFSYGIFLKEFDL